MEIICIQGAAPGRLVATLSHGTNVRQMPMTVEQHPAGGWHVLQVDGGYGPRCRAVTTAVLLEASDAFAGESEILRAAA